MSRIVYSGLIGLTSRDRAEAPHPPADDLDLHQTGLNALALPFAEGGHKGTSLFKPVSYRLSSHVFGSLFVNGL